MLQEEKVPRKNESDETNPSAVANSSNILNSPSSVEASFKLDDAIVRRRKNEESVKVPFEYQQGEVIAIENVMYQQPPKTSGSFNLMKEMNKNVTPNLTEISSTPLSSRNQAHDPTHVLAGQKQDLFKDFETIRQHPVRLGVVLNYLLNKGEKNHAKYLLFYILVDHFKNTVNKSDVSQVTRRWAAELYTSFLSDVSPVALRVPANVLEPLTEKLLKSRNEKTNWSELLEAVVHSVLDRCEKAVREFRTIFNTGLSSIAGVSSVKPNMSSEATSLLLEPLFTKLLHKLALNEELLSKDVNDTSQDGNVVLAQALRTAMYYWGVPIRDQAPHCRVTETLSNHSLLETILHRAQLSFNTAEELRGSGSDKRRNMPVVGGFFGKAKEKEKKKEKNRDSNLWLSHLFTETRIESLQHCAVCHKLLWGLPPQGWHCQHCSLTVHFGCKQCLEEECVNNKKDTTTALTHLGQHSETQNSNNTSKLGHKKSVSQSFNVKDTPQMADQVASEETNAANNLMEDGSVESPVLRRHEKIIKVRRGESFVQKIHHKIRSSSEGLESDLRQISRGSILTNPVAATNPSPALSESEKQKLGAVNRANSMRDELSQTPSLVVPPRANSDTPHHSAEIAQARREVDLSTNVSTSSSDKSLNGNSADDVNCQHSLTRNSATNLQQILNNAYLNGAEINPAAFPTGVINEEELKKDEDLQLPSGLDEYKQRYNIDANLKDMSKDFRDYQYHLHEIIATEMGHVRSLKILQLLYSRRWPPGENKFKLKIGLQHIEPCLEAHTSLMKKLEQDVLKKQYLEGGNHTITDMFSVLLEWYSVPENVIKFKKYGASFGSRQAADATGQKNKGKPDTIFTEIEDSIRLSERQKTPFWRFLDQANKHPLMEKRRFQDMINIESQRQMRIYLLLSQASSKLKKVKDQSLIGKNEAANQKEVDKISHSITSYLDKKAAPLKEYAKMDLSRYEPLDPCGIFSKDNIIYGLHIMYLHREASVRVTSLHAPLRGRRKEQNMQLLWLDDSIFFVNIDENTGTRILKNIEASSAENPDQNMKASPVIQLCHVVTASCGQPPEMKLFWYQPPSELQKDVIHLAVSIVFDKSSRAIEFKDAFAKVPKVIPPRSNKLVSGVGRSQSSTQLNSTRNYPSRSVSDVSGMYNIGSTTSLFVESKELEKVDENFKTLENSSIEDAESDARTASKTLADAFYDQSRALTKLLHFNEQCDFEQICEMLAEKQEAPEDIADMLVLSHRQISQLSQYLSSAVCASGDFSTRASLCSFLRKIKRQSFTLHNAFQAINLGEDSGEEEQFVETDNSDENNRMLLVSTPQSSQLVEISEHEDGCSANVNEQLTPSIENESCVDGDADEECTNVTEKVDDEGDDCVKVNNLEETSSSSDDKNDSSGSDSEDDDDCSSSYCTTSSDEAEESKPLKENECWEDLVCDIDLNKVCQFEQPAMENLATSCDIDLIQTSDA